MYSIQNLNLKNYNYVFIEDVDYENIEMLLIDSGSGGGGVSIGDDLMEDWVDKSGKKHRGFIDLEAQKEYRNQYPTADNKLLLLI